MNKVLSFLLILVLVSLSMPQLSRAGIGPSTCLWLDTVHVNPDSTYIDKRMKKVLCLVIVFLGLVQL